MKTNTKFLRTAIISIATLTVISLCVWRVGVSKAIFPERVIAYGDKDYSVIAINPVTVDALVSHHVKVPSMLGGQKYEMACTSVSTAASHVNLGLCLGFDPVQGAYTPDGKWLIDQTGLDGPYNFVVVNSGSGARRWRRLLTAANYDAISISNDCHYVAFAIGADVEVWNIETNKRVAQFETPQVHSISFSADSKRLAISGQLRKTVPDDPAYPKVHQHRFEEMGYTGVWLTNSGKCVWRDLVGPLWSTTAYSPSSRYVAEAGNVQYWVDGLKLTGDYRTSVILDATTGTLRWVAADGDDYTKPLFSPDGHYAAIVGYTTTALIDLRTMKDVRDFKYGFNEWGASGSFTADSAHLLCGSGRTMSEYYLGDL